MCWLDDCAPECALAEVKIKFYCLVYQPLSPSSSVEMKAKGETGTKHVVCVRAAKLPLYLPTVFTFLSRTVNPQHQLQSDMTQSVTSMSMYLFLVRLNEQHFQNGNPTMSFPLDCTSLPEVSEYIFVLRWINCVVYGGSLFGAAVAE